MGRVVAKMDKNSKKKELALRSSTAEYLTFVASTGANAQLTGTMIIIACCWAMLLPGASAPAALYHANSEWLTKKECYKYGGTSFIIMAVVLILGALIIGAIN